MAFEPNIRPATLADAAALTVLMDIAGEGFPNQLWQEMAGPGRSALEVGRERARREEGGFSYRNTTLIEVDGALAACLVGYMLDDPYDLSVLDDTPEPFQPLVRLEAQAPGTWYVNVLATFPEFRGHGLGSKLLSVAEERARQTKTPGKTPGMSVIVGSWNEGAGRLYRRAGYNAVAAEAAILPPDFPQSGDWTLMTRQLG